MSPMTPAVAGPQWMPMRSCRRAVAERRLAADDIEHRERKPSDRDRALAAAAVEAGGRHVAVADGLDLVDAILFAQPVEDAHQAIEIIDDLVGRQVMRRLREVDEIGEHDAKRLDPVGNPLLFAGFQALRDRRRHHRGDQRLGAVVLVSAARARRAAAPSGRRR